MEKEKDVAGPAIGIDLGTTYSCVAVWRNSRVEVIPNEFGKRTTASCVAFTDNELLIGEAALIQAAFNPTNTIFDSKRLIGRHFSDPSIQLDKEILPFEIIKGPNDRVMIAVQYKGMEKQLAPEQISSMVLTKMKETAEAYLGTKVMKAVITVPSYFNDSQRQATKDAGSIAGLEVEQIINSSTAAAIAYGYEKMASFSGTKNVLIFDLGSGTVDVSLIIIKDGFFEVKAATGNTHLGGNDFDNRMINHFVQEFKMKHQKDISGNPKAMRKLRTNCEKAKRVLCTNPQSIIEIDSLYDGIDLQSTISRTKFEELNMDYFEKCINLVSNCIRDANMNKSDIHDIMLVGGSTRIPMVQRLLQNLFNGKDLCKSINLDEAVAAGAAIQAAISICAPDRTIEKLRISEVNPFWIRIYDGSNELDVLFPRNTPIPTKKEMNFKTTKDNQTDMKIKFLEGEDNLISEFTLSSLPSAPKGAVQIVINFEIDKNGILNAIVQEVVLNYNNHVEISNNKRLSKKEIEKMVHEAKNFKADGEKYKKMTIARNTLEDYIYELEKLIAIEGKKQNLKLAPLDKKKIEHCITRETKWLESCDLSVGVGEFEEEMKKLLKLLNPISNNKYESSSDPGKPMIDENEWQEYLESPPEARRPDKYIVLDNWKPIIAQTWPRQ